MTGNTVKKIEQVLQVANDSLGLDLKSLIAGFAAKGLVDNNKKEK